MDNISWVDGNKQHILSELNALEKKNYDVFVETIAFCRICDEPTELMRDKKTNHKPQCPYNKNPLLTHDNQWIEGNKQDLIQFWNGFEEDFEIQTDIFYICKECGSSGRSVSKDPIIHDSQCSQK